MACSSPLPSFATQRQAMADQSIGALVVGSNVSSLLIKLSARLIKLSIEFIFYSVELEACCEDEIRKNLLKRRWNEMKCMARDENETQAVHAQYGKFYFRYSYALVRSFTCLMSGSQR
jgi:hypothetical protein